MVVYLGHTQRQPLKVHFECWAKAIGWGRAAAVSCQVRIDFQGVKRMELILLLVNSPVAVESNTSNERATWHGCIKKLLE